MFNHSLLSLVQSLNSSCAAQDFHFKNSFISNVFGPKSKTCTCEVHAARGRVSRGHTVFENWFLKAKLILRLPPFYYRNKRLTMKYQNHNQNIIHHVFQQFFIISSIFSKINCKSWSFEYASSSLIALEIAPFFKLMIPSLFDE